MQISFTKLVVPDDKAIHFLLGNIAYFTFFAIVDSGSWGFALAFVLVAALAWGIELLQKATNMGVYENEDALVMLAGSFFPTVVLLIFS